MNIGCYLVSGGNFESAQLPEELIVELCKALRTKGAEMVQFADRSIMVEGVYVPAKGTNDRLMLLSDKAMKGDFRSTKSIEF